MVGFYIIRMITKPGISDEAVQKRLNLAIDWAKLGQDTWLVYSTSNAHKWDERLRELVEPEGELFICKLDTADKGGWTYKHVWEWLKKDRK